MEEIQKYICPVKIREGERWLETTDESNKKGNKQADFLRTAEENSMTRELPRNKKCP